MLKQNRTEQGRNARPSPIFEQKQEDKIMALYEVKKINLNGIRTVDDYDNAIKTAEVRTFESLDDVFAFCGGRLRRMTSGYCGIYGDIEYTAVRIK